MLSGLDYTIIVVYMALVLLIGALSSRKNSTSEDYFMAGRSLSWFPVAMSVAATMLSANSIIGGPGWAYSGGLFPFMVNITVPLAVAFVMYTTLPVCYSLRLTSIYEYVELRLGPRTRLFTVLCFFANAVIQVGSMVYVPALIINTFTGWSLDIIIPLVVLTAIVYTLFGGMRAVIWTDVSQMLVMWVGLAAVLWIIFATIGQDFSTILATARSAGKLESLDFSLTLDGSQTFWASLLGGFVMWVNYFGFNQVQIQRVLTSRSLADAKRSFLNSAIIMNVMYFLCIFIGVLLFVMYRGQKFPTANSVMIHFITTHLWTGFVGLMVSGIFAASMSSIDSLLNSMSTVFTKDIYERYMRGPSKPTSLHDSMLISLAFGVGITVVTLLGFSQNTRSVLDVVGNYISYISGPMAAIYCLAFFVPAANDRGVVLGAASGLAAVIGVCAVIPMAWIWKPAVGFILAFAAGWAGSLYFADNISRERGHRYTLRGVRQNMRENGQLSEQGKSLLPFVFDRYCAAALAFFVAQYIFLIGIQ